jgi:ABC-2 type transport system permease protein
MKLKKYLRLYRRFLAQYLKTAMQSKADFLMGFLAFFTTQTLGILFLWVVFEQIPALEGWGFYEILFVYGFAQIPRGIDHMFTDLIWILGKSMVIEGAFDRYLLRPINPLFHICADRFQPDGLGELVIGSVILAVASSRLNVAVTPLTTVMFVASVLLGTVIYTSVKLFFASLAFWIKDSIALMSLTYNFSDFAKYPIGIYNAPVRFTLSYLLPFAYVAFFPAAAFLGREPLLKTVGLEALIAGIAWFIAYGLFKRGMRVYESAGS